MSNYFDQFRAAMQANSNHEVDRQRAGKVCRKLQVRAAALGGGAEREEQQRRNEQSGENHDASL